MKSLEKNSLPLVISGELPKTGSFVRSEKITDIFVLSYIQLATDETNSFDSSF